MPAGSEVGRHPIEGLKNPTVVRDRATPDVFPIRPIGVKEAFRRSMEAVAAPGLIHFPSYCSRCPCFSRRYSGCWRAATYRS